MTPEQERWERIRTLFDAARALPLPERADFLSAECADAGEHGEVEALLGAHDALESGLQSAIIDRLDPHRAAALLHGDADPPDEPGAGDMLGRYRILRPLGRGGMGVVYLAEDVRLRRRAAIKILPRHLVLDPDARRRFEDEARAASSLDHPGLVTVFDIGDAPDGGLFIAMAYCEGGTLGEALGAGPLPVPRAAALAIQIADGLAAAHRRGIVHRDIKPGNIIVTPAGDARIVDFGIAKVAGSALTQTALTPGTVAYMSPEQTRGGTVDVRADVWALGAVLYEMLAGRRAFRADSEQALIYAIRNDEPEPLAQLRPDVPAQLLRVVDRCLRKDVEERYPSADALLVDLRAAAEPALPAVDGAGTSDGVAATAVANRAWGRIGGAGVRWAPGIASLVLAITAVTLALRSIAGAPPLEPRRVAVAPVLNLGSTAQLDGVANMADYWITHSLLQTGFIQVVPLGPLSTDGTAPAGTAQALARREGARLVVVPAVYRDNDVLRFQARIMDVADGRLAGSVEPVEASAAMPLAGIEELGHRVLAALYPSLDTQMTHIRALPRAPRFDAYRAYIAGRDAHAVRDLPGALRNFRHAAALDSTFILPHVTAAIVMNMMGDLAGADSIVRSLEGLEDRLDTFSRAHVEWLRGSLSGDRHASYAGMREAARLAPGSTLVNYQFAHETVDLGRPHEAAELLYSITPERGELRGWIGYWQVLTAALHLQKDHRRELREAERARGLYPDDPRALIMELQALAALGRTTRIERLIEAAAARTAPGEPSPGALMLNTALELRAHTPIWRRGRQERMADSLVARAIAWYRSRPPEQQSVREHYELTIALTAAGRAAEARRLLEMLPLSPPARPAGPSPFASRSSPGFPDDVAYRGSIGVLAAGDGDPARAAEALAWLEALDSPYARGRPTYWRAAILAGLGRLDEAVALLRAAFDEGLPHTRQLHVAPELAPLRDHRPFQLLMLTPD